MTIFSICGFKTVISKIDVYDLFKNEFFLHFQVNYFPKIDFSRFPGQYTKHFFIDQLDSFYYCQSAVDSLLQEKKKEVTRENRDEY